jgi:hypothetical protein
MGDVQETKGGTSLSLRRAWWFFEVGLQKSTPIAGALGRAILLAPAS